MAQLNVMLFEFIVFSVAGWIVEVIYRSLTNKRFVNPGFLTGPYLPIYGTGALIITSIAYATIHIPVVYKFVIYCIALSLLEYITGAILYTTTGKRYWDYTDEPLNIQGHVCLPFSVIWGMLALAFEYAVLPLYGYFVSSLNTVIINTAISLGMLLMITDCVLTHNIVQRLLHARLPVFNPTQYRLGLIKFQNDALISLRGFMDTALSYRKKFSTIKPLNANKIIQLFKKRYTALISTIRNKNENHR
ncbi:MAG TPA: putative ABC transporter permease [Spirochaetota bacterium]|nr:putative ABC transporter permease [Spirochaetota bacterium]HOM08649.1 putative ABC transporter permease [Spirochaetota bacterium]HPP48560.1 putative ABC transporter permease [Spirochaetota bacterium]